MFTFLAGPGPPVVIVYYAGPGEIPRGSFRFLPGTLDRRPS
jgi:hypothetical protein